MDASDTSDYAGDGSTTPTPTILYGKPVWTLDQIVANQLRLGLSWAAGQTVTFTFDSPTGLAQSAFNDTQKAVARLALNLWSDVANIKFQEVSSGGKLTLHNTQALPAGAGAQTNRHAGSDGVITDASVELNPTVAVGGIGAYGLFSMIHELGHAIGFPHPGDYNGPIDYEHGAKYAQDTVQYSVMSYFYDSPSRGSDYKGAYGQTPMLDDVAAAQALYGVNTTTRTGDTVYGFHSTADRAVYDFSTNTKPVMSIWDAGGKDTLDVSGFTMAQMIDIGQGHFSNIAGLTGNISIAYGADIENAIGGQGDDTLIGNGLDNLLDGQGGADIVVFTSSQRGVHLAQAANGDLIVIGPDGRDTLKNVETLRFSDHDVALTGSTPLVTDVFYYIHNPDVYLAGVEGSAHYAANGWKEGRDPNAFFSTAGYLSANVDVKASGANPLTQYHATGWTEGRDPSALFDTGLYLAHNADVAAAHVDPLQHYLQYGAAEGRAIYAAIGSSGVAADGFDAEYYLMTNPDVAAAGVNPLQHYMQYGWKEGRNPNAWFDDKGYLAHNPDVAAAGINPLDHYHQFGWKEGRDPSANFDTKAYLAHYADVARAGIDPLEHYLQYGAMELRGTFGDDWA